MKECCQPYLDSKSAYFEKHLLRKCSLVERIHSFVSVVLFCVTIVKSKPSPLWDMLIKIVYLPFCMFDIKVEQVSAYGKTQPEFLCYKKSPI